MEEKNKTKTRVLIIVIVLILIFVLFLLGVFSLWGIIHSRNKMNAISMYSEWYEYVSPAFENVEIIRCQKNGNTVKVEYRNTAKGNFDSELYIKLSNEFINNNPNYFPINLGIEIMEADPHPIKTFLSKLSRLKHIF
ncbi:MAG: hypothetical protein IKS56_10445 [Lachnospiraceae bacterium]|nr:hypothetical protein [Lachnospiraceae bacterium]